VSRVADGPWAGVSLKQLWDEHRRELIGADSAAPTDFPWLIKWLDCRELLSVQVHPDDAAAKRLLGEPFGKTESWVVVHAEPEAQIFAGLKPGVTPEELKRRSLDGTVAESLHRFIPQAGDCIHLPAGTVHAVGGVVMAEVQQSSDATFRLFDWNRVDSQGKPRELHLDRALACIDFQRGPVDPVTPQRLGSDEHGVRQECLVRCSYYDLERIRLSAPWAVPSRGLHVAMVLEGSALLTVPTGRYRRHCIAGDTVMIPAAVHDVRWEPPKEHAPTLLWISRPGADG
jgi:mannose-6-phosphate isomerase